MSDSAWETCASTKNFTITTGDGLKTIYGFTKDVAGNISASSNVTMTLDSTPPAGPVANLASASLSSSTSTTFTITDCLDRPYILVSESVIAPSASDSAWHTCSTSAAAISYTLVGPVLQGSHTQYVYAKDAVGNISPSTSVAMTYDTTNPTLSLSTSLGLLYKGGDVVALSFGASDTNGLSNFKLEYAADGATYTTPITLATNATTYNWTVPASNTTTAKIRLVATDNATTANVTTVYSDAFTVDSTAPSAPILTRTSNQYSSSTIVTMTVGSCTDTSHVLISETNSQPSVSDSSWQLCSTTASAFSKTVSGDGVHTIYAWAKDLAGNIASSADSIQMTLDTTAPVIAVTTPSAMQGNVSTGSVSWTLTETNVAASTNFTVEVYNGTSWSSVGTKAATAGVNSSTAYTLSSFAVPNVDVTTAKMRVTVVDAAGNSTTTESGVFTIESSFPSVSTFSITEGSTTNLQNIRVNMAAASTISNITHFCIKANISTTPTSSDACWVAVNSTPPGVTPSTSITFSNYYYQLGFTSGNYVLYGFVKNQNGLISSLSNSGVGTASIDKATINYSSQSPPSVLNVIAANTDVPSYPESTADYSVASGGDVYIKWKASDAVSLGSTPITLYYTTDDSTFTLIASNIGNTSNTSCSADNGSTVLDDTNTGCYLWSGGAPSTYFRIRIVVTNTSGLTTSSISSALNSGPIVTLAGNTDAGVGSSASSAILNTRTSTYAPIQQFVVMPSGTIILIDLTYGLMKIDPADGKYQVLIPKGGVVGNEGDGNDITNSAVKVANPVRILLDYQNNLILWDNTRIRKINTSVSPWTISTIIGGGASSADGITATSLSVGTCLSGSQYPGFIQVRPNGKIYLIPNNCSNALNAASPPYLWVYDPNTQIVNRFLATGLGYYGATSTDISTFILHWLAMSFNPVTSVTTAVIPHLLLGGGTVALTKLDPSTYTVTSPLPVGNVTTATAFPTTGMDGESYLLTYNEPIKKWNNSTNTFSTVQGVYGTGYCADGTAVNSCKMNMQDAFINSSGQIYWMEWGLIRTTDSSGNVITIAGQNLFYGDGLNAKNARISTIDRIVKKSTGEIVLLNSSTLRIRQLNTNGNMSLLAGNGTNGAPNTTSLANAQGIAVDVFINSNGLGISSSDEVLYNRGKMVSKISSATGKWVDIAGGGVSDFKTGDGGTVSLASNPYYPKVLGVMGNSVIAAIGSYSSGSFTNNFIKSFDLTSGVQSSFGGILGNNNGGWPSNGSDLTTSLLPSESSMNVMTYDSVAGAWYTGYGANILSLVPNGNLSYLVTDGAVSISGIAMSRASGSLIIYYCASGKLKKWSSAGGVIALSWP
ncbi:MAG: hypothetical protein KA747_05620, partial [Ignavibacteriaceae bacterium]|nr:hypothetical protein [Ignavibacteriaceae bacterium]